MKINPTLKKKKKKKGFDMEAQNSQKNGCR
jgi:hypothetical protein